MLLYNPFFSCKLGLNPFSIYYLVMSVARYTQHSYKMTKLSLLSFPPMDQVDP